MASNSKQDENVVFYQGKTYFEINLIDQQEIYILEHLLVVHLDNSIKKKINFKINFIDHD